MFDPTPILSGNRRALARVLTQIENSAPEAEAALAALFAHTGRAHLVGVTGPPGSGKSSLVNELAKVMRSAGRTVAVVAVDPSSPFTGGAILGDRIRMRDLAGDPGVFIRSMATRGSLGGLARSTAEVVTALDAAGFDKILIETVGAGQAEVDIARAAHTVLVIEAPGLGDDVQAIKAGLLEVADVLVVNKADQPGADAAMRALRASLDLGHPGTRHWADGHLSSPSPKLGGGSGKGAWVPPLLQTVAVQSKGIPELREAIERHHAHLLASGELADRDRERLEHELGQRLRELLLAGLLARLEPGSYDAALEQILARQLDPARAARQLARSEYGVRVGEDPSSPAL
jgi:LAO/AO transport system kinase